jgi:hypothetical protein
MAWVEKHGDAFRVRYRLDDGTIFSEKGFEAKAADNRAADVESDQRQQRFVDPRLAKTTIDESIRERSQAHGVTAMTWSTYDSHIRNHILPQWSGAALGDISRIKVTTSAPAGGRLTPDRSS